MHLQNKKRNIFFDLLSSPTVDIGLEISGQLILLFCYFLMKKIQLDFQLVCFQLPFMLLQVMKMIFQVTKSSMGKEDAEKTVEMLRKDTRRAARKRRESTELRKEKKNYSPD